MKEGYQPVFKATRKLFAVYNDDLESPKCIGVFTNKKTAERVNQKAFGGLGSIEEIALNPKVSWKKSPKYSGYPKGSIMDLVTSISLSDWENIQKDLWTNRKRSPWLELIDKKSYAKRLGVAK